MSTLSRSKSRPELDGVGRSESVYLGLRRAIIEQALKPATKLPEDSIGRSFGVSRTLVRAALVRLAGEGLVELRPNRGAAVAAPTLAEAHDVFDVRLQLERLAVQRLAGTLGDRQLARLSAHVRREERAHGTNSAEAIRLAGEFHILLAELTGSDLLARYVREVVSRSSLILARFERPHSAKCAVDEHTRLVRALAGGDRALASRLMEQHLGAVQERALLEREPASPPSLDKVLSSYAQGGVGR